MLITSYSSTVSVNFECILFMANERLVEYGLSFETIA